MQALKIMNDREIRERLKERSQPEKFELLRVLLTIEDATTGMSNDDKELLFSMWVNRILSYDRMLNLIEQK